VLRDLQEHLLLVHKVLKELKDRQVRLDQQVR
jgi:hypothetical protein